MKKFDGEQAVVIANYFHNICGVDAQKTNLFLTMFGPDEVPTEEEKDEIMMRHMKEVKEYRDRLYDHPKIVNEAVKEALAAFDLQPEERDEADDFLDALSESVGFCVRNVEGAPIHVKVDRSMTKEQVIARVIEAAEKAGLKKKH